MRGRQIAAMRSESQALDVLAGRHSNGSDPAGRVLDRAAAPEGLVAALRDVAADPALVTRVGRVAGQAFPLHPNLPDRQPLVAVRQVEEERVHEPLPHRTGQALDRVARREPQRALATDGGDHLQSAPQVVLARTDVLVLDRSEVQANNHAVELAADCLADRGLAGTRDSEQHHAEDVVVFHVREKRAFLVLVDAGRVLAVRQTGLLDLVEPHDDLGLILALHDRAEVFLDVVEAAEIGEFLATAIERETACHLDLLLLGEPAALDVDVLAPHVHGEDLFGHEGRQTDHGLHRGLANVQACGLAGETLFLRGQVGGFVELVDHGQDRFLVRQRLLEQNDVVLEAAQLEVWAEQDECAAVALELVAEVLDALLHMRLAEPVLGTEHQHEGVGDEPRLVVLFVVAAESGHEEGGLLHVGLALAEAENRSLRSLVVLVDGVRSGDAIPDDEGVVLPVRVLVARRLQRAGEGELVGGLDGQQRHASIAGTLEELRKRGLRSGGYHVRSPVVSV